MTETVLEQDSDTRVFLLSALGSLVLHGMLVAGLVYMPQTPTVKEKPPTVQVTLMPAPEVPQTPKAPQAPTPPVQPRMAQAKTPAPPMPPTQTPRSQPAPPPLQQVALQPPTHVKPSPLKPPTPTKPILKDTRASQAMKARNMMKMRVPTQARQPASALPNTKTRQNLANPVRSPMSTVRKKRSTTRALPAPAIFAAPKTLTAAAPPHSASTITRPNVISSSKPIYPRIARESGWEGTVIVRTLIDTTGKPSQLKIRKSCGHPTLDQAAQVAVQRWTFQPAKDGNIPISKWVDIPIKFDLNS